MIEGTEVGRQLKACPCGETGALLCYHFQGDRKIYNGECKDPGCWRGPDADSEAKAARLWNRR